MTRGAEMDCRDCLHCKAHPKVKEKPNDDRTKNGSQAGTEIRTSHHDCDCRADGAEAPPTVAKSSYHAVNGEGGHCGDPGSEPAFEAKGAPEQDAHDPEVDEVHELIAAGGPTGRSAGHVSKAGHEQEHPEVEDG